MGRPPLFEEDIAARVVQRRRFLLWIALATGVGVVTGLGVAALHLVVVEVAWRPLSNEGAAWVAFLPFVGLVASSLFLTLAPGRSTETTEAYVSTFHERGASMDPRSAPYRILAAVSTISLGGSMGLEGPSIYLGALIGDVVERRIFPAIDPRDRTLLLVAGAAAGISAIFKAPLTGIIFALEVPYRDDLARRALIPAVFAAAASYLVFVAFVGTAPFFPVVGVPLRFTDLMTAVLVGAACGIAARLFVWVLRTTEASARRLGFWARPVVGGLLLAGVGLIGIGIYHRPLPLGPGYNGIAEAARGGLAVWSLLALLALKMVSTSASSAGNGVGGLFFPSVMMGAALGGAIGHLVPGPPSLFAVVGIAAFLGGAYKVPLAGVAFVAETTGAPGYVIPGLIAAAVGYLVSGTASISRRQRSRRGADLATRMDLPVADVMSREWTQVPPTASLREFADRYVVLGRTRSLPVAEGATYLGMLQLDALREIPRQRWRSISASEAMDRTFPVASPTWDLSRALGEMRAHGVDRLPVVRDGTLVGVIGADEVFRLGDVLEAVEDQAPDPPDRDRPEDAHGT